MWWMPYEGMGWWMAFGAMWIVLFWGGIIALIVWGIRALSRDRVKSVEGESPVEIARRRYAQGEITKEEFEDINATLSGGAAAGGARSREKVGL
jgi:putative membrane protein